jgi:hypothetical protein
MAVHGPGHPEDPGGCGSGLQVPRAGIDQEGGPHLYPAVRQPAGRRRRPLGDDGTDPFRGVAPARGFARPHPTDFLAKPASDLAMI